MTDCIFCNIIKEKSSTIVYENEYAIAIMDIYPIADGHMLVIPKEHGEQLTDISVESLKETMALVQKVVSAYKKHNKMENYNILQNNGNMAGQTVKHVHFHIIPRYTNSDGLKVEKGWKTIITTNTRIESIAKEMNEILSSDN